MADGLDIIVVTGLSGSGKSVVIRALEDNGFFCIDNLPVVLIPKFIDLCQGYREEIKRIALGIDLRERLFLQSWPEVLTELRVAGHRVEVLFLDAADEVLLRRFSETRRPHPLAGEGSIQEGIVRERKALEEMRALADKIIDTNDFKVPETGGNPRLFGSALFSARVRSSPIRTRGKEQPDPGPRLHRRETPLRCPGRGVEEEAGPGTISHSCET